MSRYQSLTIGLLAHLLFTLGTALRCPAECTPPSPPVAVACPTDYSYGVQHLDCPTFSEVSAQFSLLRAGAEYSNLQIVAGPFPAENPFSAGANQVVLDYRFILFLDNGQLQAGMASSDCPITGLEGEVWQSLGMMQPWNASSLLQLSSVSISDSNGYLWEQSTDPLCFDVGPCSSLMFMQAFILVDDCEEFNPAAAVIAAEYEVFSWLFSEFRPEEFLQCGGLSMGLPSIFDLNLTPLTDDPIKIYDQSLWAVETDIAVNDGLLPLMLTRRYASTPTDAIDAHQPIVRSPSKWSDSPFYGNAPDLDGTPLRLDDAIGEGWGASYDVTLLGPGQHLWPTNVAQGLQNFAVRIPAPAWNMDSGIFLLPRMGWNAAGNVTHALPETDGAMSWNGQSAIRASADGTPVYANSELEWSGNIYYFADPTHRYEFDTAGRVVRFSLMDGPTEREAATVSYSPSAPHVVIAYATDGGSRPRIEIDEQGGRLSEARLMLGSVIHRKVAYTYTGSLLSRVAVWDKFENAASLALPSPVNGLTPVKATSYQYTTHGSRAYLTARVVTDFLSVVGAETPVSASAWPLDPATGRHSGSRLLDTSSIAYDAASGLWKDTSGIRLENSTIAARFVETIERLPDVDEDPDNGRIDTQYRSVWVTRTNQEEGGGAPQAGRALYIFEKHSERLRAIWYPHEDSLPSGANPAADGSLAELTNGSLILSFHDPARNQAGPYLTVQRVDPRTAERNAMFPAAESPAWQRMTKWTQAIGTPPGTVSRLDFAESAQFDPALAPNVDLEDRPAPFKLMDLAAGEYPAPILHDTYSRTSYVYGGGEEPEKWHVAAKNIIVGLDAANAPAVRQWYVPAEVGLTDIYRTASAAIGYTPAVPLRNVSRTNFFYQGHILEARMEYLFDGGDEQLASMIDYDFSSPFGSLLPAEIRRIGFDFKSLSEARAQYAEGTAYTYDSRGRTTREEYFLYDNSPVYAVPPGPATALKVGESPLRSYDALGRLLTAEATYGGSSERLAMEHFTHNRAKGHEAEIDFLNPSSSQYLRTEVALEQDGLGRIVGYELSEGPASSPESLRRAVMEYDGFGALRRSAAQIARLSDPATPMGVLGSAIRYGTSALAEGWDLLTGSGAMPSDLGTLAVRAIERYRSEAPTFPSIDSIAGAPELAGSHPAATQVLVDPQREDMVAIRRDGARMESFSLTRAAAPTANRVFESFIRLGSSFLETETTLAPNSYGSYSPTLSARKDASGTTLASTATAFEDEPTLVPVSEARFLKDATIGVGSQTLGGSTYEYDTAKRPTATRIHEGTLDTSSERYAMRYGYDPFGRMDRIAISQAPGSISSMGRGIRYSFDTQNRIVKEEYYASYSAAFDLDDFDTAAARRVMTIERAFDKAGRPKSESTFLVGNESDAPYLLRRYDYAYNQLGLLKSIEQLGGSPVTYTSGHARLAEFGNTSREALVSGLNEVLTLREFDYDTEGRLLSEDRTYTRHFPGSTEVLLRTFDFAYSPDGELLGYEERPARPLASPGPPRTAGFSPDPDEYNSLRAPGDLHHAADIMQRMTAKNDGGVSLSYNPLNGELVEIVAGGVYERYAYDDAGMPVGARMSNGTGELAIPRWTSLKVLSDANDALERITHRAGLRSSTERWNYYHTGLDALVGASRKEGSAPTEEYLFVRDHLGSIVLTLRLDLEEYEGLPDPEPEGEFLVVQDGSGAKHYFPKAETVAFADGSTIVVGQDSGPVVAFEEESVLLVSSDASPATLALDGGGGLAYGLSDQTPVIQGEGGVLFLSEQADGDYGQVAALEGDSIVEQNLFASLGSSPGFVWVPRPIEAYEYTPYGIPTIHSRNGTAAELRVWAESKPTAITFTNGPITSNPREGNAAGDYLCAADSPIGETLVAGRVSGSQAQSSIGLRHLFTARPWTPVGELYQLRARWYSPRQGRFTTLDPLSYAGGLGLLMYCAGNPVNFVDPWGESLTNKIIGLNPWPSFAGKVTGTLQTSVNFWSDRLHNQSDTVVGRAMNSVADAIKDVPKLGDAFRLGTGAAEAYEGHSSDLSDPCPRPLSWPERVGRGLDDVGRAETLLAVMGAGAGIGKLGKKGFDEALCKFYTGGCFAAGTLVHTPSGPVPIEALRPGDWVVTVDVATGERCAEQVLGVSAIEAERMVELAMPDGEMLRATAEHPFWTEGGWKAAALAAEELGAGAKEFSHREVVYNLEVKANHTYLVGRAGWVVHNACPNPKGQLHHAISKKVHNELERNPATKGLFRYRDRRFETRGATSESHRGYQKWHRNIDDEVSSWIKTNAPDAEDFVNYLKNRYGEDDLIGRFPNGL